ncbi:type IVB secretion system protein IcmV [Legionella dresdenensis]|uniref:Type IVB secretion system protein IcmV n=1 Tax=Legionella dresdenensis TaxID=450200 RepID=A0ABV8CHR8_9GAMM
MKKQSGLRTVALLKAIFDFRRWIDYERIRAFSLYLLGGFKKMFIPSPQNKGNAQSFEQAAAAQKLTEEDITARQAGLYRLAILMILMAILVFGYTVFQLINENYKATLISMIVGFIALVLAFRYHFWYFQLKKRKLGCSLREWYRQGLLGEHDE